ncbi:4-hydroxy-3-methylbut-2-enyl diphosphate reductase [Chloroflexota bacterium]
MQIERARELGLCYGVQRAVRLLREAAATHGRLETLGPIAHNRLLLAELESLGVRTVDDVSRLSGPVVAVSAHGVSPRVMSALEARGLGVVDTTCPNVSRVQHLARSLSDEGFSVVVFGEADHSEVKGLLGWAGGGAIAALAASDVVATYGDAPPRKVAVIVQTTQRAHDFATFAQELSGTLLSDIEELRFVNTRCTTTDMRQAAAVEMARTVDVVLVIGGYNSANTCRLAETCASLVETHHIEDASELQEEWVREKRRVGITAGASTPDSSIEKLEERLRSL